MRKLLILPLLVISLSAHAATFESVDEALVGWHYAYQASSYGHQVPVYFTLRKCSKGPTVVMAQGHSPIDHCFGTEEEARVEAKKWADKEELRYREIQNPNPTIWDKVKKAVGQ